MSERPPTPTEEFRSAWRRECLTYRETRAAGGSDQEAHEAAVAAVLSVWPTLTQKEASAEAVNAIAHATIDPAEAGLFDLGFIRGANLIRLR